jgi:hypothetical protein
VSTDCDTNNTTERNTPLNGYLKDSSEGGASRGGAGDFELENETCTRTPGRALHMHEKLLLLNRKTSPNERRRKHEEKQARAQEKREQFYQERLSKLRDLTKRVIEFLHFVIFIMAKSTLKSGKFKFFVGIVELYKIFKS